LNFGNACSFITSEGARAQNELVLPVRNCSLVDSGVFQSGLNAAVQHFLEIADSVAKKTEASNGAPNLMAMFGLMQSPEFQKFGYLLLWWLPEGFRLDSHMYLQAQLDSLAVFVSLRTTMLVIFLTVLAVFSFLVFEPMVYALDLHVKRVRALLVMLPAEVVMSTASLRNALMSAI